MVASPIFEAWTTITLANPCYQLYFYAKNKQTKYISVTQPSPPKDALLCKQQTFLILELQYKLPLTQTTSIFDTQTLSKHVDGKK